MAHSTHGAPLVTYLVVAHLLLESQCATSRDIGDSQFSSSVVHIKNFAPGRIVRFGNPEYAADSRGELAFSGWVSDQIEEHDDASVHTQELVVAQDNGVVHITDPTSSQDPNTIPSDRMSATSRTYL